MPYEAVLERIAAAARTIAGIAQSYLDVPQEDTSPDERRKLAEVQALLDQALELLA